MCALVIRAGFVGSCVLQEDSLQYKGFDWSLLKSEHCFGLFWSLSKCIIYNAVTWMCIFLVCELVVIIIINPLTVRVVGAPQIILQPIFSIFPCSPRPSGTCQLQACPFPDVVFPPLPLSALSYSPFHCALQDGFGQTWWTGNMTIPLQFASLYDRQEVFVWSNCLLDLGTDFLVGNMAFEWDV